MRRQLKLSQQNATCVEGLMFHLIEHPESFFSDYLKLTGIAHLEPEVVGDEKLIGKRLGVLNGASWIMGWSYYFGRRYLPGVHLINVGNEAVQINFMQAHREGKPVPPASNIATFVEYAKDLVELAHVDAILITCSTMNRSYPAVSEAMQKYGVPVVQIDMPMMEAAVREGGKTLIIATHGPTVENTKLLLGETAERMGESITYRGLDLEAAWCRLAQADVAGHNEVLAEGIRQATEQEPFNSVVLAQLSMSAFLFTYPDPIETFGIPVFTSGQCGFERVREILLQR
jgi:hypothetical protein